MRIQPTPRRGGAVESALSHERSVLGSSPAPAPAQMHDHSSSDSSAAGRRFLAPLLASILLSGCGLVTSASSPPPTPARKAAARSRSTLSVAGDRPGHAVARAHTAAVSTSPVTLPRSRRSNGSPAVGALFSLSRGQLGSHFCSGSVVHSSRGDLVLTAAHCLESPAGVVFVPGYRDHSAPYGIWPVERVLEDKEWANRHDPNDDFAFLVLAPLGGKSIESVTGAEQISYDHRAGVTVRVSGYPDSESSPATCSNTLHLYSPTQFEFGCWGYTDGTSGSPMLADVSRGGLGRVVGVIGGYEQGGNTQQISYAARLGRATKALYALASSITP